MNFYKLNQIFEQLNSYYLHPLVTLYTLFYSGREEKVAKQIVAIIFLLNYIRSLIILKPHLSQLLNIYLYFITPLDPIKYYIIRLYN